MVTALREFGTNFTEYKFIFLFLGELIFSGDLTEKIQISIKIISLLKHSSIQR